MQLLPPVAVYPTRKLLLSIMSSEKWIWSRGRTSCTLHNRNDSYLWHRIVREATAKSSDGRIDQSDFMNYAAASSRYSLFTPMEAAIVFHFAGRGGGSPRLALVDFAQLLNPKWRSPQSQFTAEEEKKQVNVLNQAFHSLYNFALGGTLFTGGSDNLDDLSSTCKVLPGRSVPRWCIPLISLRYVIG